MLSETEKLRKKANREGITIGIIGTAGRKEDGAKMSKELYGKMYRKADAYISNLGLEPRDITLVSGGAAYSDHIAVSLYLDNKADNLTLHLPCEFRFLPKGPQFFGKAGSAAK